jgi:hypothetical protein
VIARRADRATAPPAPRGFTIIELLTAMTLFLTLGIVLFGLLRQGLGLFQQGESRRSSYERGIALLDELAADLRLARAGGGLLAADPDIALLVDRDAADHVRLRFVRPVPRELAEEPARAAGSIPGGEADLDFMAPRSGPEKGAPIVRGLRGLAEVAYVCDPDPSKDDPAPLRLRRAMKAPPGGEGSLFVDENLEDERFRTLASGVLHFGVEAVLAGEDPEFVDSWDSTRGRLKTFSFFVGPQSLTDFRDDLFPSALRLTLTLEREDAGALVPKLDSEISEKERVIAVSNAKDLPAASDAYPFVKIENEWIRVAGKDLGTFTASERGARGSTAVRHARGARVHSGETLARWVEMSGHREAIAR